VAYVAVRCFTVSYVAVRCRTVFCLFAGPCVVRCSYGVETVRDVRCTPLWAALPMRRCRGDAPGATTLKRRCRGGASVVAALPRRRFQGGDAEAALPRRRFRCGAVSAALPKRRCRGGTSETALQRRRFRKKCRCAGALGATLPKRHTNHDKWGCVAKAQSAQDERREAPVDVTPVAQRTSEH
jgi:hypothetical protein